MNKKEILDLRSQAGTYKRRAIELEDRADALEVQDELEKNGWTMGDTLERVSSRGWGKDKKMITERIILSSRRGRYLIGNIIKKDGTQGEREVTIYWYDKWIKVEAPND